ncbi:hypothetical protein TcasGA2_TC033212 [Tribolium castaneum]|uniref:Gustatory receptor n=1 Tax=Tribolium castaneum TaxID=7070 RepID=A0A139WHW7_TRICA|nr:hypothetical protein TcasGA2_TC033212 [Tribolium castaneum]
MKENTTQNCLYFMLVFAQCFGMLPVTGISEENCKNLKFKWSSKRTFYSLTFALVATANTVFFLIKMIRGKRNEFQEWVALLFFFVTVITVVIFLDVAKKWPQLMKKWTEVDTAMNSYGFPIALSKKLKTTTLLVISAAIVEHGLFVAVASAPCEGKNWSELFNNYFKMRFDYVFDVIPYHFFWGIMFQVLNIFSTVSWNFMDLFIILISLCLSERFKQVATRTNQLAAKEVTDERIWEQLREDYTRLTILSHTVDKTLANTVVLSFANNLFVILVQLFYSLQAPPRFGILNKLYYVYSFAFLIIRMVAVALNAATINNESLKPKYCLNTLPHFLWNVEYSPVVLTGHKLFKITNALVLQITVAIVTYELIMIQYPSNTPPEKSQLSTADTANLINKSLGKHNLQKSFAKVVILAQIFGFFPAQGILGRDFRAIHFTWASARVGYTIVTILGATFVTVLQLHKIFAKGLNVIEANRLFFYCSGLASGYLYLKLAMKWPRFMKDWSCVEVMMASYGWPAGLNRRLNVLLAVFMSLALIEYILMQTNKLVLALECNNSTSEGFDYFFGKMSYSHIFSLMDYNIVMALVLQFITLQHTFIWVFNDVFVMLLSTALAYRFTQVTDRTQSMSESKNKSESAWKNLREDYNRLCRLCKRVDEEISYIVLMSFASDLLFILIQLFNSLRQMKNNLERIYFYWSFGFLIVRTVCLCLFGGKVNDESTQPMLVLNSVSADIQRFIHQIGTLEVAFTGKNFFSITRGLILSIAGAIVSYELVLMQFNDSLLETISEQIDSCPVYLKMLILAQIFGFFPVQGVRGPDFRSLRFSWKSARVVYALFTLLGTFLISGFQMQKIATKGLDLLEANRLFFFLTGVMASLLFLNLAKRWPKFVKDWCVVDATFASYGWPKGLNKKLNTLTVVFMLIALVEHILVQTNKLVLALECNNTTAEGFTYFLGNMSFAHIFALVEYDIFKALVLQTINLQITFIWTYNDLFVMLISTALAYRFGQITRRIAAVASEKIKNEIIWKKLREDYTRQCRLVRKVDKEIAYIVLLTFASDLLFILIQLFNSLRRMRNDLERLYFYWSFALLITRIVCLCLFGAKVHDESIKPLLTLNSVPTEIYNLEIQRFIQQIGNSDIAITGKNFFSITRGLILSILHIFGLFPVSGLSGPDYKSLKFSWRSFKFLYSLCFFCILCLFVLTLLYNVFFVKEATQEITNVLFYLSAAATNAVFLQLAKNWSRFIHEWHCVEVIMGSVAINHSLKKRLKIITIVILVVATVEHLLIQCYIAVSIFGSSSFEADLRQFYKTAYSAIFTVIDFSLCKAILVHAITIRSTFSWTFIDVFIMLTSTAFVFRLKQLNAKVEMLKNARVKNTALWKQLRYEHYRLYQLSVLIDNNMSYIIIVSFATNLYFIIIQLFGSMKIVKGTLKTAYYLISFALLIMRLISVCLCGASVHSESSKVLPLLFSVSSSSYNCEVERFIDQVIKNEIILTGKKFFKITKQLILQIAGAIVTYELVVIHAAKTRPKPKSPQHEKENVHKSLKSIIVIAQIFGYFPVQGVLSNEPIFLNFSWFSLRVVSSLVTIITGVVIVFGHIRLMAVGGGYSQFEMNGIIFYACGTLSCIFFLKLSMEWQSIMLKWQEVDLKMSSYGWPKNLNRRINVTSAIFLLLEAAEHVLIQSNKLVVAIQCKGSFSKGAEHFFVNMSFPIIFDLIKPYYGAWLGVFLQIVNTRMAFSWTFIDLFIILMSCALAARFRQINTRIRCLTNMKVTSEKSWIALNDDYNRLCHLCFLLDEKLSYIILTSFLNNFYFIIFQVFESFYLHKATTLETVYYFISLGLLILRLVSVCFYGSWINEESKLSLDLLSYVPREVYNKEISRLVETLKFQSVGLTGKRFFKITKQLILKITSAVVTYELIVIQFRKKMERDEKPYSRNSIC